MGVIFVSMGALGCYLAGTVGQGLRNGGREVPKLPVLLITALGLIFHVIALYTSIHTDRGINLGVFTMGSLTAMMVTMMVLLSSLKKPSESLLVMILPVSMLAIVLALLAPVEHIVWNPASSMVSHVLFSVMAYGILMVAAFQAILLSYQEHKLRTHRHTIRTLPPLQTMERLLFEFLSLGVILLTFSLGSGFLFLEDMFAQKLVHKTVLSLTAWCLFAALLVGHWRFGWRGQTAVRWTLAGFVILILAYFGTRLVLDCVISGQHCF
ncbi:inner membrane protein YpjD [Endozoicomonas sp. SCSIO W0465]|uniref:cytochrome C assembly family protein n=1 Tax=Endozoicomonas sp. SCSIO W0465 TaxID=2918516 RepID=UPI0020761EB4|nr:cytochrome c biogenesis protein CcsA [Endozoicomonas sp. SCSIO W0465]USE34567.1 cytochrome c biogenesis protein CcsA [Endozoicomonas sp. SCSIO W0465]